MTAQGIHSWVGAADVMDTSMGSGSQLISPSRLGGTICPELGIWGFSKIGVPLFWRPNNQDPTI